MPVHILSRKICKFFLFLFLVAFSLVSLDAQAQRMSRSAAVTEVGDNIPDQQLVQRLRKGGLVILFRHGFTDHSQSDSRSRDHADCSIQRNLDAKGCRESQETGMAFKKLGIPVGDVFTSPKCRTRDTGLEAFGRAENLSFLFINHTEAKDQRRAFLGTIPKDGKNVIAISHGSRIKAMVWFERGSSGPWSGQIQEGDAIVLDPLGDSKFRFLAKVEPEDWLRLQKNYSSK
jgi:phosphohistidine phosphatase SixA